LRSVALLNFYEFALSLERSLSIADLALRRAAHIKNILRGDPSWASGHLKLAEVAEVLGDLPLIYGSTHAVEILSKDSVELQRAKHLRARCYLKRGLFSRARTILEEILAGGADRSPVIIEDLAATYFGDGDKASTKKLLDEIPPDKRSAEVLAMVNYLGLK